MRSEVASQVMQEHILAPERSGRPEDHLCLFGSTAVKEALKAASDCIAPDSFPTDGRSDRELNRGVVVRRRCGS